MLSFHLNGEININEIYYATNCTGEKLGRARE